MAILQVIEMMLSEMTMLVRKAKRPAQRGPEASVMTGLSVISHAG